MQVLHAPAAGTVQIRHYFASTLREQLLEWNYTMKTPLKILRIYATHVLLRPIH
jgi:hypothetical protein